jgi:hypothetical protein
MIRTPTNCTVTIKLENQQVGSLTGIPCLLLPARPEITSLNGLADGKAFEFMFKTLIPELTEQCQIVRDDNGQSIRVIGVMHVDSPRAYHTEGIGEGTWGAS